MNNSICTNAIDTITTIMEKIIIIQLLYNYHLLVMTIYSLACEVLTIAMQQQTENAC